MKLTVISIIAFAFSAQMCFSGGAPKGNDTQATVVARPDLISQNSFYPGNRAPLKPAHFIKLPHGSVQAEGWVAKLIELQKDGLCGHLREISAWLSKENNAWLSEGGDYGWEEVPFWLRGYSDMASLLDDPQMKKEAMVLVVQPHREKVAAAVGRQNSSQYRQLDAVVKLAQLAQCEYRAVFPRTGKLVPAVGRQRSSGSDL